MVISARIAMSEQGFSTQEEYAYSRELEPDEYTLWENELCGLRGISILLYGASSRRRRVFEKTDLVHPICLSRLQFCRIIFFVFCQNFYI
jgi:hypothetical protein